MDKQEFKRRWESNENGGGITFDDIAECAIEWGISSRPRTMQMDKVQYKVLQAADVIDAESYNYEDD
jgi:hypothetical protein